MGKKIKIGLLAIVGVLGLAAFAPSKAQADEGFRGGFHGERVERRGYDRDWRRDRFEHRWHHGYWRYDRFGRSFWSYR